MTRWHALRRVIRRRAPVEPSLSGLNLAMVALRPAGQRFDRRPQRAAEIRQIIVDPWRHRGA